MMIEKKDDTLIYCPDCEEKMSKCICYEIDYEYEDDYRKEDYDLYDSTT